MKATSEGYRYIVRRKGVRGGNPIVDGSRIGVHDVVSAFLSGATIDDIIRSFPDLSRAQVYECLAYYEDHKDAIDYQVARQMADPD